MRNGNGSCGSDEHLNLYSVGYLKINASERSRKSCLSGVKLCKTVGLIHSKCVSQTDKLNYEFSFNH